MSVPSKAPPPPPRLGRRRSAPALALVLLGLAGCNDPVYLMPRDPVEVLAPTPDPPMVGTATITLPIRLETADEATERADLSTTLGVGVPYVVRGDLGLSLEWTIKNLSPEPGTAVLEVNGGNELYYYDPQVFVIDPDEEEPPPALLGGVPMTLEPNQIVSGVFTEDQLDEAAIDLDQITRGGLNPITAMLVLHEDLTEFTDVDGLVYPEQAFAGLVRLDLVFQVSGHMVLEYAVRVRDHRGILHPDLLDASVTELTAFAPVLFE